MTHIGTIPLETDRLILRRFTAEDDSAVFLNWANDPDVTKYLTWKPHGSIEETRRVLSDIWLSHYDELNFYQWAIEIKDTNELIGSIGVVKHDDTYQMVHIGYCIGKAWWHKGYTSEALTRLVRFFFEDVGVNRIESRHDPRNLNSGKVMQKAGFRYEGTSLQSDLNNQGICDAANYAILARDYFHKNHFHESQKKSQKKSRKNQSKKSISPLYRRADASDISPVTDLLCELYGMERGELLEENKTHFTDERQGFFLAYDSDKPIAVAHAALRNDYVNGTEFDGTCGYLEGIYVKPEYRLNGVAAALVHLCEAWAKEYGCREFASDCLFHNTDSYLFHLRTGFTETERCIFFRKEI